MHIADAQGLGDDFGAATVVAGQQVAADVPRAELLHGLQGAGFESVAKGKEAEHFRFRALLDQPGQGSALGFPSCCRVCQGPSV
ncbi:hypothetical protein D3C86_2009180 [compost metagenome]